jgi:hypothetical protein
MIFLFVGIGRNMEPVFEVKIPVPWGHVSGKQDIFNTCKIR